MRKPEGRRPKYEADMRKQICNEYLSTRISRPEIAAKYSVSVATVDKYVKEFKAEYYEEHGNNGQ